VPAEVADRLLQPFGPQQVAHFRVGPDDAQLNFTFRQLAVQPGEHPRAGDVNERRIGQVADDEPELRGRV